GDELPARLAVLAERKATDVLDDGIGKAGDAFDRTRCLRTRPHGALRGHRDHRLNSEVDNARPPPCSRSRSSPDSNVPPSPPRTSAASSSIATNEARIEYAVRIRKSASSDRSV